MVNINGTNSTTFKFTNNQTNEEYTIDLWTVGINLSTTRKQITFLLHWETAPTNPPTRVEDGVNYINVPNGEYNYECGNVKGLMRLVEPVTEPTTYENNDEKSVIYNG